MTTPAAGAAVPPSADEHVAVPAPTRVVALHGPAGSGKSTVARAVARALGWRFVDTGATYRAVTLAVLRSGADLRDEAAVTAVARAAVVHLTTDPDAPAVTLDGEDVSSEVRGPEVTAAVSAVAAVPGVRRVLIDLQRIAMGTDGAVTEGRDIATVVAPGAQVKVFLDARPEVRAARRAHQDGTPAQAEVQADLARRDSLDSKTNKLEVSEGAIHLDTSDLTLQQVVDAVVALVPAR